MHKISDKAESACGPVLRLVADMDGIENTHLIGDVVPIE